MPSSYRFSIFIDAKEHISTSNLWQDVSSVEEETNKKIYDVSNAVSVHNMVSKPLANGGLSNRIYAKSNAEMTLNYKIHVLDRPGISGVFWDSSNH